MAWGPGARLRGPVRSRGKAPGEHLGGEAPGSLKVVQHFKFKILSLYSHLNATQHSFEGKDIVILDKERKWFGRGIKKPSMSARKRREPQTQPTKSVRHDTAIKKSLKDSSRDNSLRHGSLNRKISQSDEASRMRCDINRDFAIFAFERT